LTGALPYGLEIRRTPYRRITPYVETHAIRVVKILTGEIEEDTGDSGKDKVAKRSARRAERRGGTS
jgi:hypothetical protein